MSDKPSVWAYARASTKKQEDSPEVQQEKARQYAALHQLGDITFFVDIAKSGKIPWEEREGGRALFARLRPGDHVIIAKLDRAFRKLSDCVIVLEKFERMGVKLHVVNLLGGAIDLSSPMGKFLIHILAAFAELERAFISERTKEGLAHKKRKGVVYTNYAGYGWKWEKRWIDGKLTKVKVRDDEEREVMRSIAQWRLQEPSVSWDEIRNHLRHLKMLTKDGTEWSLERIRRACKAEFALQMAEQRNRLAP